MFKRSIFFLLVMMLAVLFCGQAGAVTTVSSISPTSGTTAGGTSVTITGSNFTGASSVTIGGTAATGVTVISATSITAITPAGTPGARDVVVITPDGSGSGLFTYIADGSSDIPKSGWSLKYVDSQELVGENGAAVNAFDGNVATFWHTQWLTSSPPPPHEIQVDLGLIYNIDGFRYLPRQNGGVNGTIGQYEFYVSVDGINWDTPVATGIFANNATEKEVLFTAKNGRFVRLRALTEVNGKAWTSMAELSVMGGAFSGNQPPNGTITGPSGNVTINAGESVTFAGTGSDPDGNLPLSYRWNFGAASGVSDSLVKDPGAVRFDLPGTYTVTFTVTDSLGLADPTPATVVVTVKSGSPAIPKTGWSLKYVDSQELVGENGAAVNVFDGNVATFWHTQWLTSSPLPPHEIQIDLGLLYIIDGFRYLPRQDGGVNGRIGQYEFYVSLDGINWGTPVAAGIFANSATEKEVKFTAKNGRFVRLRALTEVNGKAWTSMAELSVMGGAFSGNQPPNGTITGPSGNVTINAGESVTFAGTGSDPDGNLPLSFRWNFGANSGVSDSFVKDPGAVRFDLPGTYTVTFTVTDSLGVADPIPATVVVAVKIGSPAIPKTGWSLKYVDSQELVGENGAAVNAFDGNVATIWHTQWLTSSPLPPHEIQIDLGLLYIIDGFRYLPRQDGHVNGRVGQYEFYVSSDGVNWGTPVATGTFANNATEKEVKFTAKNGRFVRLRALTEVNGKAWTSMAELNVMGWLYSESQAPNSAISSPADNVIKTVAQDVMFAGNGSDPNGFLPLTYHWNFGAGSGVPDSSQKDPGTIQFFVPGTYSVTLSATNSQGVADPTPASVGVRVVESYNPLVTDFFTNALGVGIPTGWTERWVTGQTSYTIQNSTDFPVSRELYYQTNALEYPDNPGGARRLLTLNAADNLDANTEILVLFEPHLNGAIHTDTRAYLRASGEMGNETAYFFTQLDTSPTMSRIYKYVNGVMTSSIGPDQVGVLFQSGRKYWERFRASGINLSAKLWPYGGLEPLDWDVMATDTSITAPGWSGIGIFHKNDYGKFFQVAVADNGATAVPLSYGVTPVRFNLSNMDAEVGNTSGWSNEFGTMVVDKTYQRSGTSCFAGSAANWRGYRRIDLAAAGVTQDQITQGAYISFSAWQRAFATNNDPGRAGIRFLDISKAVISTILAPWDNTSVTYTRKHLVEQIPLNAAYVDLILEGQYISGASAGAYFDDLEVGYSYKQ